jgi:hypothetical protein
VVSVPLGRLQLMANALGRAAQFVESLQEPPVRGPNKVA